MRSLIFLRRNCTHVRSDGSNFWKNIGCLITRKIQQMTTKQHPPSFPPQNSFIGVCVGPKEPCLMCLPASTATASATPTLRGLFSLLLNANTSTSVRDDQSSETKAPRFVRRQSPHSVGGWGLIAGSRTSFTQEGESWNQMSATNLLHDAVIKAVCVDKTSGMYGGSTSQTHFVVYSSCVHVESDIATNVALLAQFRVQPYCMLPIWALLIPCQCNKISYVVINDYSSCSMTLCSLI